MKNATIFYSMVSAYIKASYAHNYIFGYTYKGNVYMTIAPADIMPTVCTQDIASRGGGYSVRFKPNKRQKEILMTTYPTTLICSETYFNEQHNSLKYNKGEIFEKLVTEYYNQEWNKDNVPFTKDGDITINNVAYQIKYEKGTFCNEKSLVGLT